MPREYAATSQKKRLGRFLTAHQAQESRAALKAVDRPCLDLIFASGSFAVVALAGHGAELPCPLVNPDRLLNASRYFIANVVGDGMNWNQSVSIGL
jgi:hypothetical protein